MMEMKVFKGSNPDVTKFVFEFDDAVAEAVLYKYPDYQTRTVLCISVQSGCRVGCSFCGTGRKFIRNLTTAEILKQVDEVFKWMGVEDLFGIKKLQIMFMSMGEPFHNYPDVSLAIEMLATRYRYSTMELLVSTIGPREPDYMEEFLNLSSCFPNIGLQLSIHDSSDKLRDKLIPYKNKLNLIELRDYGIKWYLSTGRKPYCNYCLNNSNHSTPDFDYLNLLFPKDIFCFTFSVICSKGKDSSCFRDMKAIRDFEERFIEAGYDTRVFDPAGQDDIGGGCGQLWYVQKWMEEHQRPSAKADGLP